MNISPAVQPALPRRRTRPVATVFENLKTGLTVEAVMKEFSVTREQINAVLDFAAKSLETASPAPTSTGPAANDCEDVHRISALIFRTIWYKPGVGWHH
jgi:hypothetical protein